jgi:hypothetical protein
MYTIRFQPNDKGTPAGKLADAELHFTAAAGPLAGLKLCGFGLWNRRSTNGFNVTMPARQYSVNGERRSWALLRPIMDASAVDVLRETIIDAWRQQQRDDEPNITPNVEPYRPATVPTTYDAPPLSPAMATATARVQQILDATHKPVTPQIPPPVPGMTPLGIPQPKPAPAPGPTPAPFYTETVYDLTEAGNLQRTTPEPTPQPAPGLFTAPDPMAHVKRYDNPDDAAAAARAGTPICLTDLIARRPSYVPPTPATTPTRPRPGFTPAGDPINF